MGCRSSFVNTVVISDGPRQFYITTVVIVIFAPSPFFIVNFVDGTITESRKIQLM